VTFDGIGQSGTVQEIALLHDNLSGKSRESGQLCLMTLRDGLANDFDFSSPFGDAGTRSSSLRTPHCAQLLPPAERLPHDKKKGAPACPGMPSGVAFETWDPPGKGESPPL
jgi:hypothetical protein